MIDSEKMKSLRKEMLKISAAGCDGNLPSCFSSLEILWVLYAKFLPVGSSVVPDIIGNKFVLSKGQSNLALMMVLAEKGMISKEELYSFCKFNSRISMQVDRTKFDGLIEVSAGSLGHGFPISVGMAWAKKIKGEKGRVFCLAGDGEMNEGTMWEAAVFAASEGLDNLILIIDDNGSVGRMVNMGSLSSKLEAFGFDVAEVSGHDTGKIERALARETEKPCAVLAKTVRGWGSRTLMDDRSWFHRYPKGGELDILCREVDEF